MQLLHHGDVVKARVAGLAPADIFKAAGHIFLPVEVVGLVPGTSKRGLGAGKHLGHGLTAGEAPAVLVELGGFFEGQGVDRDVAGVQADDLTDRIQEGIRRVAGESGNQVHIDAVKPGGLGVGVGPEGLGGGVAAANAPENLVGHGLGVDAHAVRAALADDLKLLKVQGVGPSALHGELQALGEVEMLPDGGQQPLHLGRGEGGGGAAADVKGADCPARLPKQLAGMGNFSEQRLQVGRQVLAEFLHALAHKGAVGAAGGAEGNAHIDREVPGAEEPRRLHGVAGGVDAQPPTGFGDEVGVLQKPVGAGFGAAGQEVGRGELGGPHTGQGAPGRRRGQHLEGRQVKALL